MTVEQFVEQLRRLEQSATPGPWGFQKHPGCKQVGPRVNRQTIREVAVTPGLNDDLVDRANAELIAAMRNAFPALLDIAEAAQTVASLKEKRDGVPQVEVDEAMTLDLCINYLCDALSRLDAEGVT